MMQALASGRGQRLAALISVLAILPIRVALARPAGSASTSEILGLKLPAELRVTLTGMTDDNPFGPLPGTLVIDSLPDRIGVQVGLAIDPPEQVGTLFWSLLSLAAAAGSNPPYKLTVDDGSFQILLQPGRYDDKLPSWIFAQGKDTLAFSSSDLVFAWARQGSLQLGVRNDRVTGKIRLQGTSDLSGRPVSYLAQIVGRVQKPEMQGEDPTTGPVKLHTDLLASIPPEELPLAMQQRDKGDKLRLGGSFGRASEHYEKALTLYRQEADSATDETMKHSAWISERGIVSRLIFCYSQLGDIEKVVAGLNELTGIDSRLRQVPYLRRLVETAPPLTTGSPAGLIEVWLSRLGEDRERIKVLEASQSFFEAYILYLAYGHAATLDALEVSELARARAFAALLAQREGSALPPEPVSVEQILDIVARRRSTTIEYLVTEKQLVTWVITPSGEVQASFSEVRRDELTAMVDELIELLQAADVDETPKLREILRRLYDLLIQPIEEFLPSAMDEVVTVIPHGPLFRLPFAALRFGDGEHDYLVHRWAFVYGSSIATLDQLSGPPHSGRRELLALVNPHPMPTDSELEPLTVTQQNFPVLSRFYESPVTFFREKATETGLRQLAGGPGVLYLGTHGFAERDEKIESAVVLARDKTNDGLLEPHEVYTLDLDTELVVLAACETGRGKLLGDGVLGLARAFFAAGARSMLVSLWQLPEELTLDQTVHFHHHWLQEGLTKAVALQRAQSRAARNDPFQPGAWAGLILAGGWE